MAGKTFYAESSRIISDVVLFRNTPFCSYLRAEFGLNYYELKLGRQTVIGK